MAHVDDDIEQLLRDIEEAQSLQDGIMGATDSILQLQTYIEEKVRQREENVPFTEEERERIELIRQEIRGLLEALREMADETECPEEGEEA